MEVRQQVVCTLRLKCDGELRWPLGNVKMQKAHSQASIWFIRSWLL